MYEFIKGTVQYVSPEYVVIENNGIGYQVTVPNPFFYSKDLGQDVIIYTYTYVREDILLYMDLVHVKKNYYLLSY